MSAACFSICEAIQTKWHESFIVEKLNGKNRALRAGLRT
jgi:hypothetical protein